MKGRNFAFHLGQVRTRKPLDCANRIILITAIRQRVGELSIPTARRSLVVSLTPHPPQLDSRPRFARGGEFPASLQDTPFLREPTGRPGATKSVPPASITGRVSIFAAAWRSAVRRGTTASAPGGASDRPSLVRSAWTIPLETLDDSSSAFYTVVAVPFACGIREHLASLAASPPA